MDKTTMTSLLAEDEERVRGTLCAGQTVDKSRESGLRTLSDELGALLRRYNAACVDDPERQAAAAAMTATARDGLDLLLAGKTELTAPARQLRLGAPWLLIAALACGGAGVWLLAKNELAACICLGAALLLAFVSGRIWTKLGAAQAVSTLDPERLWHTLKQTAETMDRKLDELSDLRRAREERRQAEESAKLPLEQTELELVCELLEALYTASGDYALRQLKRLRPYLREKGIETVDYGPETAELFERLPSKQGTATLRPALLYGGKLLMAGRAAAPMD